MPVTEDLMPGSPKHESEQSSKRLHSPLGVRTKSVPLPKLVHLSSTKGKQSWIELAWARLMPEESLKSNPLWHLQEASAREYNLPAPLQVQIAASSLDVANYPHGLQPTAPYWSL